MKNDSHTVFPRFSLLLTSFISLQRLVMIMRPRYTLHGTYFVWVFTFWIVHILIRYYKYNSKVILLCCSSGSAGVIRFNGAMKQLPSASDDDTVQSEGGPQIVLKPIYYFSSIYFYALGQCKWEVLIQSVYCKVSPPLTAADHTGINQPIILHSTLIP